MTRGASCMLLCMAFLLLAVSQASDVTLPNGITVAEINKPTESSSTQGDNPTVSEPDQEFTGSLNPGDSPATYINTLTVGDEDGNAGANVNSPYVGRKMRKMLESDLHLYGSGVSAGDQDAGVAANAYGQGQLAGVSDSHIEPHGVQTSVSLGGQEYTTNTGVDPDGVAKEGPIVEAGKK